MFRIKLPLGHQNLKKRRNSLPHFDNKKNVIE